MVQISMGNGIYRPIGQKNLPYYLRHFYRVMEAVLDRYPRIFTGVEKREIDALQSISPNALALLLRMYGRSHTLFRADSLAYLEIDLGPARTELVQCNYIHVIKPGSETISAIGYLLTRSEIIAFLGGSKTNANKAQLVEALADAPGAWAQLPEILSLQNFAAIDNLLLAYFGNSRQDLSTFVVAELEHLRYIKVRLSRYKLWRDAQQFRAYKNELVWQQVIEHDVAVGKWRSVNRRVQEKIRSHRSIRNAYTDYKVSRTAGYLFLRFLLTFAPEYRRRHPRSYWRFLLQLEQLSWPLDLLSQWLALFSLAARKQRKRNKLKEINRHYAENLQPYSYLERMNVEKNEQILQQRRRQRFAITSLTIHALAAPGIAGRPGFYWHEEILVAEELVGRHFSFAWHCENTLPRICAILLFLDEIFAPVKGQFQSPFQAAPLDFRRKSFYQRRRKQLKARSRYWYENADGILPFLRKSFIQYEQFSLPGLWLRNIDSKALFYCLERLQPLQILAFAQHFIENPGAHGRGFPDLCLQQLNGDIVFAEVKSPSDQLSEGQKAWLTFLDEEGFDVILCKIATF
jgi:hypothetical protein